MIKSIFVLLSSLTLLLTTGCSPKASDSDVGRSTETDGFRVKEFNTVSISPVDSDTEKVINKALKSFSSDETMTSNGVKTEKFFNDDDSQMISVTKKANKVTSVKLEGISSFTNNITDKVKDKNSVSSLTRLNAKKKFGANANKAESICKTFTKKNGLKSRSKKDYMGEVTEEFRGDNKRLVTNSEDGFLTVIVEGDKQFIDAIRKKLQGLK